MTPIKPMLLAAALLSTTAAMAADAPTAPPAAPAAPAVPAAAARFTLDTPIETLAADQAARAVLDADLPHLLTHPAYAQFKGLSLTQLAPFSQGLLTESLLATVGQHLAAIR